jgi:hypothetical protein
MERAGAAVYRREGKVECPLESDISPRDGPLRHLRSMDLVATNSDTNADWSTRIAPTVSPLDSSANPNGILAWEWIIDLANRAGVNLWLNIPVNANATYLTSLANLVFANLQARSGLTVYIEWGNEDWWEPIPNATAKTLGGGDATKGTVVGSTTMFQAFQAALTASGRKDIRLVRVLGGQCVNTYLTGQLLADLPSGGADAFAIAPYVGSATTVTSSDFASEYQAVVGQVAAQYALTKKAGLALVGYEGGQNSSSETSANTDDPSYYVPYGQFLQGISQYMTIFNNYMHCNGGTTGGWAAEENVGDVSSSSKAFRVHALFDWNSGYTAPPPPARFRNTSPAAVRRRDASRREATDPFDELLVDDDDLERTSRPLDVLAPTQLPEPREIDLGHFSKRGLRGLIRLCSFFAHGASPSGR